LVEKLECIQKDFLYNLGLIEQRDRDLVNQEKEISHLNTLITKLYLLFTRKRDLSILTDERDVLLKTKTDLKISIENIRIEYQELVRKVNLEWEGKLEQRDQSIRDMKEQFEKEQLEMLLQVQKLQKQQETRESFGFM
jgi:hypothetical protein